MLYNKDFPRHRTTESGTNTMNDRLKGTSPENAQDQATNSPAEANQPKTPSRRELIERYAKAAVVAAPLLLFVSKAQAIHSKPP
jgi:hypothetical protein